MGHGSNYTYNAVPFYSPPGSPPTGQQSFSVVRDYGDGPGPGIGLGLGQVGALGYSEPYSHTPSQVQSNARSQSVSHHSGPGTGTSSSEYNRESRHDGSLGAEPGPPTGDSRGYGGVGGFGVGPGMPGGRATSSRKLPVPPRAVTVLQHTDASDVGGNRSRFQGEPPEIVEVPPAYSGNRF